jgi:hypothetical protein
MRKLSAQIVQVEYKRLSENVCVTQTNVEILFRTCNKNKQHGLEQELREPAKVRTLCNASTLHY